MSTVQRSRIGMFHRPPEQQKVVVGRNVAVDGFVQAVERHGRNWEYALFCHGTDVAYAAKQVSAAHVSVRGRRDLAALDSLGITAWHEPQFDTFAPFAVRARSRAPFPVTILHHTVSYKELLHESILRLLLAKPHAYDAILCTSSAARIALQRLVARTSRTASPKTTARSSPTAGATSFSRSGSTSNATRPAIGPPRARASSSRATRSCCYGSGG